MDRSLRRVTGISKQSGVVVREYFKMKPLEPIEACMSVLRANDTIAPFFETVTGPS